MKRNLCVHIQIFLSLQLLIIVSCSCVLCEGPRPEDPREPAAGPGVFGQGQVVQHPGGWLEHADPAPDHCPARAAARPPRIVAGVLRLFRRRRLPKLYETIQLVERGQGERSFHLIRITKEIGLCV